MKGQWSTSGSRAYLVLLVLWFVIVVLWENDTVFRDVGFTGTWWNKTTQKRNDTEVQSLVGWCDVTQNPAPVRKVGGATWGLTDVCQSRLLPIMRRIWRWSHKNDSNKKIYKVNKNRDNTAILSAYRWFRPDVFIPTLWRDHRSYGLTVTTETWSFYLLTDSAFTLLYTHGGAMLTVKFYWRQSYFCAAWAALKPTTDRRANTIANLLTIIINTTVYI